MNMNTIKFDSGRVKMIAHRGLSGIERENTMSAFVAAGNREKYFGIETDVHKTRDGKYVIFHDDNTSRVGIDSLVIEESTFDTLRKLQLTDMDGKRGRTDLLIPTVDEYISICKKYGKTCVFELKNEFEEEDVYRLAEMFEKADYMDHVIFISFQLVNLVYLRRRYPDVNAQFLIEDEWKDEYFDDLKNNSLGLDIDHQLLTKEIADTVHAMGKEVNVWTVNTVEDAEKCVKLGVDYITTNILE